MMNETALLIPAYNTESTLGSILERTRTVFETVVVVNDGSSDGTIKVAESYGVTVLTHERNRGKGAALRTGFQHLLELGFEAVMTMDADGQHNPDDIPLLLQACHDHPDEELGLWGMVIGSRFTSRELIPSYRYYPNRFGQIILSLFLGQSLEDTQSGFRIYRSALLREIELTTDRFEAETEIMIKAARNGYRILFVPIETIYPEDEHEKSNFRPILDTIRIARCIIREMLISIQFRRR